MHWADVIAIELLETGTSHRIATGITPSGHIHVGNMREILTGDLLHRAIRDAGGESTLLYLGDTFDPLRKVYPFLDSSYQQYVGMPLSEIPCPCGDHESYAIHFLDPFLASLETLGVDQETLLTHELYKSGKYAGGVKKVLENREHIQQILERVSKRSMPENWFPYTPKCHGCGKFGGRVTGYHHPYVEYQCDCGNTGEADIRKDDGKLPWRVDWPTRWWFLGITCEPFGKDHGAAGGSYDTGKEIVQTVFGRPAPHPVMYEWIQLKGKGAMSSSTGVVVTGVKMLEITPPEVLRFLIAKQNPFKHIDFDPGLGILNLVDEYDRYERIHFDIETVQDPMDLKRAYELSEPNGKGAISEIMSIQIPYRHLVTLVQLTEDPEELKDRIRRTEGIEDFSQDSENRLLERANCARSWIDSFAPEGVKFSLRLKMPDLTVTQEEREFLQALFEVLTVIPWDAEDIHKGIHESSRNFGAKKAFKLLYRLFLDTVRGPRLGFFFSGLDREFVLKRIKAGMDGTH